MSQQRLEGDEVAVPPETGDDPETYRSEHRRVAERLSRVHVRQVRLDDNEASTGDRVTEGDAVMREGTWVEDDAVDVAACLVEPADELAFDVRLEVDDRDVAGGGVGAQVGEDVVQGVVAVDLRLACSEEVEVRSVEDEDSSRHGYTVSRRP
jgi:hypothetical protein